MDSGSMQLRRGRPATGHSAESLALQKLNKELWRGVRSRIWLSKRVHLTWKVLKGTNVFNTDSDFTAHLFSLKGTKGKILNTGDRF